MAFSEPDIFLGFNGSKKKIDRAREVEKKLLDSFSLSQLAALSHAVYIDIRDCNQKGLLSGILPPHINSKLLQ